MGIISRCLLICGLVPALSGAAPPSLAPPAERLVRATDAQRLGTELIKLERGVLRVPENRAKPGSAMIELPYLRLLDAKANGAAPIFYLAGGPGQPILKDLEPFGAAFQAYQRIGGRGDLVLVEQRGVGQARPALNCPGNLARPFDQPLTAALMAASHDAYVASCIRLWQRQGVDLAGYDLAALVADIDELRQALGFARIKLFGESFGALHGLALLQRDDKAIERAALAAVIGPDDMFELPAAIDRELALLGRLARSDPGLAGQVPDLPALMQSVLAKLDPPRTVPVHLPDGRTRPIVLGQYDLQLATVTLLRNTAFLEALPELYLAMQAGDFGWLAQWSARVRQGQSLNLMSLAVTCALGASPARRAMIKRQSSTSPFGPAVDLLSAHACDRFPASAAPPGGSPIKTAVPLLLLSGELDPRAPPGNVEQLLPGLARARHIVLPGVSHDFGGARDAQLELVYRFLADGEIGAPRPLPGFGFRGFR